MFSLQEIRKEVKRTTEKRMSRCFNWFPFWCIRRTQVIPELGLNYNVWVGCGEGVCESYKYLHLTGLWLGMMDRINATDRNVYSIPHPSSLWLWSFSLSKFDLKSCKDFILQQSNPILQQMKIKISTIFPMHMFLEDWKL